MSTIHIKPSPNRFQAKPRRQGFTELELLVRAMNAFARPDGFQLAVRGDEALFIVDPQTGETWPKPQSTRSENKESK
jgi:hypothetical protein